MRISGQISPRHPSTKVQFVSVFDVVLFGANAQARVLASQKCGNDRGLGSTPSLRCHPFGVAVRAAHSGLPDARRSRSLQFGYDCSVQPTQRTELKEKALFARRIVISKGAVAGIVSAGS